MSSTVIPFYESQEPIKQESECTPEEISPSSSKCSYTGMKRYIGMLLAAITALCSSFGALFAKMLTDEYKVDAYSTNAYRCLGVLLPSIPILLFYQCKTDDGLFKVYGSIWPINRNWKQFLYIVLFGFLGSSSALFRYSSFQYLSLGDAIVISYSTPIVVTILAHFMLSERCGLIPIIATFTALLGVFFVSKPPLLSGKQSFDENTLIGVAYGMGSLTCSAITTVLGRKIRECHYSLSLVLYGLVGLLLTLVMQFSFKSNFIYIPTDWKSAGLIAGVGSVSFGSMISGILSLKFEQAGIVALIRSSDIVFALVFQIVFMGSVPDALSFLGSTIVLLSILILGARKWIVDVPKHTKGYAYFSWILK